MRTVRIGDPRAFRAATEAYLQRSEAKHNLMLGLLETLIDRPDVYPESALWLTEEAGVVESLAQRLLADGTALPAHVTREQISRGKALCLLYTDKANPTSNSIYHRIGYRVVCDAAMVVFEEAG